MPEHLEKGLSRPESFGYQELKKSVERLEKPAERLKMLIGEFDRTIFPDEPLEVNVESEPEEPWGEGEEVVLSGYRDEHGDKRWMYEINPKMEESNYDELLRMAVHEVRHRVQRERSIKTVSDKESFSTQLDKFSSLEKYKGEILEYAERIAKKREHSEKRLPPHIEKQEFDALVVEVISPAMMKRGMSVKEVSDEIIAVDVRQALSKVDSRLKE